MPAPEALRVRDDEKGLYGRDYWFSHQKEDLGYPDLGERARLDLPERCLHWLKILLTAKLPPARVLEVGCAHGGFVALMRWAGFDATGLELSPFVVRFAQETFHVPVLLGPLEDQQLPSASLDAIVMYDVLEHLPDPVGTLAACGRLLNDDGVLIVQTPWYKGWTTAEELHAQQDQFVDHLKASEHLFLFSNASLRQLFAEVGFPATRFEPSFFAYDQFVVAGRTLPDPIHEDQSDEALGKTPSSRLTRALLDKDRECRSIAARLQACEEDRAARLAVIKKQGAEAARVPGLVAERDDLTRRLVASEEDRAARLAVIEKQGAEIGRVPGLIAERDDLARKLVASEVDRAARLEIIESLEQRVRELTRAIEAARPRARVGIALPGEVRRIRRVVEDAIAESRPGGPRA